MENNSANDKWKMGNPRLRVALVCDWLVGTGGAERVVLELHHLFPEAPIYTSQYDSRDKVWFGGNWFADADVRTSWLQKLPKFLRKFLPVLRAWTFSRLDLSKFDLVISVSGAEAKYVRVKPGAVHISYCHAPTHYYWARYNEYLKSPGFGALDPLARNGLKLIARPMRRWDYRAAQRPDYFIANSTFTKDQIKKYYGRDSVVIYPPVDVERFRSHNKPAGERHGFVSAGRQTPYKRIDLAIEAATKLNLPLIVIGRGPDHKRLARLAGRSVTFLSNVSDGEMPQRLGAACAFIFPAADDFGIVAVEALAAGTPVIAYAKGGALDYINPSNGILFDKQTPESLTKALETFKSRAFNHDKISRQTDEFSADNFRQKMNEYIKNIDRDRRVWMKRGGAAE